jgi:probable rRNA maturation factor
MFRRVPATLRRAAIVRFAGQVQKEVGKGRPFGVLITGDAELRRLNRDFRGKDYATDVLSFPAGPEARAGRLSDRSKASTQAKPPAPPTLGDIAISLGRARAQAREFRHTIEKEVQILMLHGVLHLLGSDHETDSGQMARAEKRWRARLGLPNGLIERVQA